MKQLLIGIPCLALVLLRPGMTTALQPSEIPGLKLWLDASVGVTTEDNSSQGGSPTDVRLWVDRSHSGGDVANTLSDRATRPQWLPRVAGIGWPASIWPGSWNNTLASSCRTLDLVYSAISRSAR